MKQRTRARGIALQALYELDMSRHPILDVVQERLEAAAMDDSLNAFSVKIVNGVFGLRQPLDEYIARHAPEWPMDQVAVIDRNILRIALWELALTSDTPVKVIINEAVELAKLFGSDSTPRFVNGVLGSLVDDHNAIRQHFSSLIKTAPE